MTKTAQIQGTVAIGFEAVKREFERNFSERKEQGAAVAVYHKGEKVVDLWGGIANHKTGRPWKEDTMVTMFSTTKGVASMAMAVAHSRGWIDYDETVATYWPEFAQNGKEKITVRQLLSHQAGLSAIDEPLDLKKLADPEVVAAACAMQKPAWEPGENHGYHGLTLGWYESELLRQVDPQKRTIGRFFQEEVADPLNLSFYIGLPDHIPEDQLALINGYAPWKMIFNLNKLPWPFVKAFLSKGSLTQRSFSNPEVLGVINNYNTPEMRRIELPAANGMGTPRSVACAYSEFATGGETLGITAETLAELAAPPISPKKGNEDLVIKVQTNYSLGYAKPSADFPFGSGPSAFGTPGAGGSFGFADPDAEIGFCYGMNKSGFYLWDDPREKALRDAVYQAIS